MKSKRVSKKSAKELSLNVDADCAALALERAQAWAADTSGKTYDEMFPVKINAKESVQ